MFAFGGGRDRAGLVGVVGRCCDADVDRRDGVGGRVWAGLEVAEEVDGEDCHEG